MRQGSPCEGEEQYAVPRGGALPKREAGSTNVLVMKGQAAKHSGRDIELAEGGRSVSITWLLTP